MQHVMNAELSNPSHPGYGVATIPFPIPDEEYQHCLDLMAPLEIGGVTAQDCKVEQINGYLPSLKRLEGTNVNLDELDILAHILDMKIDDGEDAKFEALVSAKGLTDIRDMINLALCCEQATVIKDFSELRKAGIQHYITVNGGSAPVSEVERQDGLKIMTDLIASGKGVVTPYGVVYDNGMSVQQSYQGGNLPVLGYDDILVEACLTPAVTSQERKELYLLLPMQEKRLERMLARAGFESSEDYTVCCSCMSLPSEVQEIIKNHEDQLLEINRLCNAAKPMKDPELDKLAAAVLYAKPEYPMQVRFLAENLDLFDFIPKIQTPEEYGKFMIQKSGHFDFDENLIGFYDYKGYGEQRTQSESGEFNKLGYICYTGTMNLAELMMKNPAEQYQREQAEEQSQMMGGLSQ